MASDVFRLPVPRGAYVEREDPRLSWLDEQGERLAGSVLRRLRTRRLGGARLVEAAGALAAGFEDLSDAQLRDEATFLRAGLRRDGFAPVHVARSFALVREAARRTVSQRPYDVQLLGGNVLLRGMVAEMETGEGKTLSATLPACTAALAGIPVHVITVNDYLVSRDAENMGPIYQALGLSVGAVVHGMDLRERRGGYGCDVTYVSNKELAFDYLKDRLALGRHRGHAWLQLERLREGESRADHLLLRGLCYGIVDEADSVLIDEARTPLIISGPGEQDGLEQEVYRTALEVAEQLHEVRDYTIERRARRIRLTLLGEARIRKLTRKRGGIWQARHRGEEFVTQALTALWLFVRDKDYLVTEDSVQIIDEYTGRVMPDRSWERGLHQMIEVKEGLAPTKQVEPLARISYQRFFRRYMRLAGMTGTAREVAAELWSIYRLPVARIPTNRPLRRESLGSRVFRTEEEKWDAIIDRIEVLHQNGRPVLIGTRSVAASEALSERLTERSLAHQVLNARQDLEEAEIIGRAGRGGHITVATNMAGRGTDIELDEEGLVAGGLHVIATERHDARRIDRQLMGRAGRQGDPGSYEMLTSLEDEVLRSHGSKLWSNERVESLVEGAASDSRLRAFVAGEAQRRAERLHAKTRRRLLKSDERIASMLAFSGEGE